MKLHRKVKVTYSGQSSNMKMCIGTIWSSFIKDWGLKHKWSLS
jgi:hypothetical protein